jgi:hypothetical protein
MMKNDIIKIPEKYIINRWKKETKVLCTKPVSLPVEDTVLRFNNLSLMSTEMAAEGSKSTQKYNYLTKEIDIIMEEMKMMDS